MGRVRLRVIEIVSTLSETVGFKSGLALNREQIAQHLQGTPASSYLELADDTGVVIRSDEFEEMYYALLYAVGRISTMRPLPPVTAFVFQYRDDTETFETAQDVVGILIEDGKIDLAAAFPKIKAKHGTKGLQLAQDFLSILNGTIQNSPWSKIRTVEWQDTRELAELFGSEKLENPHGRFFDQRFVDYLHRNFNEIDRMNWRQFEGMTAEFFDQQGWYVRIGPGRKDGGIDVRVWPKEPQSNEPAAILVQCKRQKDDVEEVVVKALHDDVRYEAAEKGLIVTSHRMAPGARDLCRARRYPIDEADRETIKAWIDLMRTPGEGVFLGE